MGGDEEEGAVAFGAGREDRERKVSLCSGGRGTSRPRWLLLNLAITPNSPQLTCTSSADQGQPHSRWSCK